MENGTLTRMLPKQDVIHTDAPDSTTVTAPVPPSKNTDAEDQIVNEILNKAKDLKKKHQIHFE